MNQRVAKMATAFDPPVITEWEQLISGQGEVADDIISGQGDVADNTFDPSLEEVGSIPSTSISTTVALSLPGEGEVAAPP